MKKVFLKSSELSLKNGGYLTGKEGTPVNNVDFYNAQKHAEFVVKFAKAAKGKNFEGVKPDCIDAVREEVLADINKKKVTEFVATPKEVKRPTTDKLQKEALDFISFQTKKEDVDKTNEFLAQFEIIHEFENFGLFFEEDIVKLNRIYTMEEITEAVSSCIDLLPKK